MANGILVESGGQAARARTVTAVWDPQTGALKAIGRDLGVMAAYTPPGARYSLLAWLSARCSAGQNCPLQITNTATLSTQTVRSPLHHGFAIGAAFSPGGKQLAVFVNRNSLGTGTVQLAMVDAGTRAMRLVGAVRLGSGRTRLGVVAAGRASAHRRSRVELRGERGVAVRLAPVFHPWAPFRAPGTSGSMDR